MKFQPEQNDGTLTWVGCDNKELIVVWFALLDRKKALEGEVRKVLYKSDKDYVDPHEAREQADRYAKLAEITSMLAELGVALEEWGIKAP